MPPMDYSASSTSFFESPFHMHGEYPGLVDVKTEDGRFCMNTPFGSAIASNSGELYMTKAGGFCSNSLMGSDMPSSSGESYMSKAAGFYSCPPIGSAIQSNGGESCMSKVEQVFGQRGVNNFAASNVADKPVSAMRQSPMMAPDSLGPAWWFRAPFASFDMPAPVPNSRPKRRNVRISKDPQSVAARHRRERISERIRILQSLVPGGSKMDTASMLEVAIQYVKLLKEEVQKLETTCAGVQKLNF